MSGKFGEKYYDLTLNALRIMAAFLYMIHGGQKLFGWFGMGPMPGIWPFGVAGVIEFFGALAIAFGLFTRPLAFLAAGETAVVYFWMHASKSGSIWPWVNHGEVPVLYCFIFLVIWTSGGGSKTLDAWLAKRRAP
ncbi:MAG TPA: DoxX family protein [Gemmatimonadales bacterium]|nr:DoxX family protein [Gemmatimonadales bacterium]